MEINKKVYIYGLHGNDGIIRYIGKTTNLNRRYSEHINEYKYVRNKNYHKINWIKQLLDKGEDLHISIIEECNDDNWIEREIYWISKYSNLTNIDDGGKGGGQIRYKMSYDDVKKWVNNNLIKIDTIYKWRDYVKTNNLPNYIPKRPDSRYKNNGWISWEHFFEKINYITYDKLRDLVRNHNLKSKKEYLLFKNHSMPYNPETFYNEWISWKDFLNKPVPIKIEKNKNKLNFNEAKNLLQTYNFTKKIEYINFYLENKTIGLPRNPIIFYKEYWISWQDFFGNNNKKIIKYIGKKKSNIFIPYEEAKLWVQKNYSLNNEREWRKITKKLPNFIPKRPDYFYKNNGWEGFNAFLLKNPTI